MIRETNCHERISIRIRLKHSSKKKEKEIKKFMIQKGSKNNRNELAVRTITYFNPVFVLIFGRNLITQN